MLCILRDIRSSLIDINTSDETDYCSGDDIKTVIIRTEGAATSFKMVMMMPDGVRLSG